MVAYKVAQFATDVFRERNQEIDAESAQDVVRFIDKQRREAQDRLEEAERALQQFSGAGQVFFIGEGGGMMSKVSQAESMLEQAETERRLAETNLASFDIQLRGASQQGSGLPSVDSIPDVVNMRQRLTALEDQRNALAVAPQPDSLAAAELDRKIDGAKSDLRRAIMAHTTESLPADDKKAEELRAMLTQRVVAEQVNLSSTRNKERFYNELLDDYRRQSPERLEKTMEISRLRRTQAVHQNLLNYLVERHEEAKIKAATGSGGIRIVNPAAIPLDAELAQYAAQPDHRRHAWPGSGIRTGHGAGIPGPDRAHQTGPGAAHRRAGGRADSHGLQAQWQKWPDAAQTGHGSLA